MIDGSGSDWVAELPITKIRIEDPPPGEAMLCHARRKLFGKNGNLGLKNNLSGVVGVEEVVPIIFAQEAARKINASRWGESKSDVFADLVTEPFQVRHDFLFGEAGESRKLRRMRRWNVSCRKRRRIVGLTFVALRRQALIWWQDGDRRRRVQRCLDWWPGSCGC
jgi:hypothetical protein